MIWLGLLYEKVASDLDSIEEVWTPLLARRVHACGKMTGSSVWADEMEKAYCFRPSVKHLFDWTIVYMLLLQLMLLVDLRMPLFPGAGFHCVVEKWKLCPTTLKTCMLFISWLPSSCEGKKHRITFWFLIYISLHCIVLWGSESTVYDFMCISSSMNGHAFSYLC